ncbi:MAG: rod shape-determining protein MreD [Pseudomonadota bacterium]
MAEVVKPRIWRNRALYLGLAFLLVFERLLPLGELSGRLPGPDLILVLTYALALRRPDAVPTLLVAGVFLMTDVLFMRPLGLWTACVLLGLEFLRAREPISRDQPFLGEWTMVAGTILAVTVLNTGILSIFAVIRPTLGQILIQMIVTALVYPAIVVFCSGVLGIMKVSPGAVDPLGNRL